MKKASPEEIRRAHEQHIKKNNGVYDEVWAKYRDDLRLANKLIRDYDKFLDEQGAYHSNSHTEEDL